MLPLVSPVVFDDHLVVILQVPLVDKYLIMNVYIIYNLSILHPVMKKTYQCFLKGEYLTLSCDGNYATIP